MAHTLGQFAFAVKAFAAAHVFGTSHHLVNDVFRSGEAACLVGLNGLFELLEAELDVVEILNGFAERYGNVGQHGLEIAESLAHDVGTFRRHAALGHRVGNEHHDTPVLVAVEVEILAVFGRHEGEHLAVYVVGIGGFEFLADMSRHCHDVVHQHLHVGEDGVVHVLQHVVGSVAGGHYFVSGIDKSVAERLDFFDIALDVELRNYLLHVCLIHSIYRY